MKAVLYLPDGKQVPTQGTVVRSFRAPSTLRSLFPSGFGLRVSRDESAEYDEYSSSQLRD